MIRKGKRAMVGALIIVAWLAGLALLIRREYFRPQYEKLAEAGMRITPGVVYYGVMQGDKQVGFASSTIDTAQTSLTVADYFVADIPVGGKSRRASARSNATLSRALHVKTFDISIESEGAPIKATGNVEGDSVLVLQLTSNGSKAAPQRFPLTGPVLLPTLVPLALALGESPAVGRHYTLPVFDPTTMTPKEVGLDIRAETTFVVNDSSAYDSTTKLWHGIQPDTIKAWNVAASTSGAIGGWIDEQGRLVTTSQLGFTLKRMPYEVAFENWRNDSTHLAVSDDRDILETTAIAANKRMDHRIEMLKVRLSGVDLSGFDLDGQRQHLNGDTLTIEPLPTNAMNAGWEMSARNDPSWCCGRGKSRIDEKFLKPEPRIQSNDDDLFLLAYKVQHFQHDPTIVAEELNRWVHDSIAPRVTFGVPSALEVLKNRVGDCNEHTQLYVAMARAVGLPARVAAGLAYVDGKFYYHAWPEVFLSEWVAVDPTFGQFPADAAHLRFTIGGLERQTSLLRLMGNLKIDVLEVNGAHPPVARRQ
jgi:hypothetical protein